MSNITNNDDKTKTNIEITKKPEKPDKKSTVDSDPMKLLSKSLTSPLPDAATKTPSNSSTKTLPTSIMNPITKALTNPLPNAEHVLKPVENVSAAFPKHPLTRTLTSPMPNVATKSTANSSTNTLPNHINNHLTRTVTHPLPKSQTSTPISTPTNTIAQSVRTTLERATSIPEPITDAVSPIRGVVVDSASESMSDGHQSTFMVLRRLFSFEERDMLSATNSELASMHEFIEAESSRMADEGVPYAEIPLQVRANINTKLGRHRLFDFLQAAELAKRNKDAKLKTGQTLSKSSSFTTVESVELGSMNILEPIVYKGMPAMNPSLPQPSNATNVVAIPNKLTVDDKKDTSKTMPGLIKRHTLSNRENSSPSITSGSGAESNREVTQRHSTRTVLVDKKISLHSIERIGSSKSQNSPNNQDPDVVNSSKDTTPNKNQDLNKSNNNNQDPDVVSSSKDTTPNKNQDLNKSNNNNQDPDVVSSSKDTTPNKNQDLNKSNNNSQDNDNGGFFPYLFSNNVSDEDKRKMDENESQTVIGRIRNFFSYDPLEEVVPGQEMSSSSNDTSLGSMNIYEPIVYTGMDESDMPKDRKAELIANNQLMNKRKLSMLNQEMHVGNASLQIRDLKKVLENEEKRKQLKSNSVNSSNLKRKTLKHRNSLKPMDQKTLAINIIKEKMQELLDKTQAIDNNTDEMRLDESAILADIIEKINDICDLPESHKKNKLERLKSIKSIKSLLSLHKTIRKDKQKNEKYISKENITKMNTILTSDTIIEKIISNKIPKEKNLKNDVKDSKIDNNKLKSGDKFKAAAEPLHVSNSLEDELLLIEKNIKDMEDKINNEEEEVDSSG